MKNSVHGVITGFNQWLFEIGNENCDAMNRITGCFNRSFQDEGVEDVIHISKDMLVNRVEDPIKAIVETTYPNFLNKYNDLTFLKERVVLTTKNETETIFEINDYMMNILDGSRLVS